MGYLLDDDPFFDFINQQGKKTKRYDNKVKQQKSQLIRETYIVK